jgi:hypothetical protein
VQSVRAGRVAPPPLGHATYEPVVAHEYLLDKLNAITVGNPK